MERTTGAAVVESGVRRVVVSGLRVARVVVEALGVGRAIVVVEADDGAELSLRQRHVLQPLSSVYSSRMSVGRQLQASKREIANEAMHCRARATDVTNYAAETTIAIEQTACTYLHLRGVVGQRELRVAATMARSAKITMAVFIVAKDGVVKRPLHSGSSGHY